MGSAQSITNFFTLFALALAPLTLAPLALLSRARGSSRTRAIAPARNAMERGGEAVGAESERESDSSSNVFPLLIRFQLIVE